MNAMEQACSILPKEWGQALMESEEAEEIRLRLGRPPTVLACGREQPFFDRPVDRALLNRVLEAATNASFHAVPSLGRGYVCYQCLRIGVCGESTRSGEKDLTLRNISSLAIRIPHDADSVSLSFAERLLADEPQNTLIAAPPGAGKTSLLRALIRKASERGYRVGVIDERAELWAPDSEGKGFDLGPCSDVVTGKSKLPSAMHLLRSMNPQIIAMDEITEPEDADALRAITGCGVCVFATVHARDRGELYARQLSKAMLEEGMFSQLAVVFFEGGKRNYRVEPEF